MIECRHCKKDLVGAAASEIEDDGLDCSLDRVPEMLEARIPTVDDAASAAEAIAADENQYLLLCLLRPWAAK